MSKQVLIILSHAVTFYASAVDDHVGEIWATKSENFHNKQFVILPQGIQRYDTFI